MLTAAFLCSIAFSQVTAPTPPKGFRLATDREIWQLGPKSFGTNYHVTLNADKVRVETLEAYYARLENERSKTQDPKPRHSVSLGNATGQWRLGEGAKANKGWIQGWDAGEFGGGLFWFSEDGSAFKKIDGSNTQHVEKTTKGIFAFQSLNHLMFSYSRFVKVEEVDGEWKTRLITDLHDCPLEVVCLGNRFLYIGPRYVSSMELDGTQRLIYRSIRQLESGGMIQRKNGEIWIGNTQSVLCLTPTSQGEYEHFWYVPK